MWLHYLIATIFFLLGAVCIILVVFQLPGAWIMFALAVVIEVADSLYLGPGQWTFSMWLLITCLVLLIIGEAVEFFAGVIGAQRAGASRRGMIGSLIGGILGAIVLMPFFVFGALVGAVIGTFVGAVIGELSAEGTRVGQTVRPAIGATIGRVLGTMSKVGVALVLWIALTTAAFWP